MSERPLPPPFPLPSPFRSRCLPLLCGWNTVVYPFWINEKVGKNAWQVLRKVIEIDCACNARPATIEVTPADLGEWLGLDAGSVMRTLEGLRRKKCLALFLPEHPEERALIEVRIPLPTPKSAAEVRDKFLSITSTKGSISGMRPPKRRKRRGDRMQNRGRRGKKGCNGSLICISTLLGSR